MIAAVVFWMSAAILAYVYVLYPLLAHLLGRRGGRPLPPEPATWPKVTVVIAAHDEAARIGAKLASVLASDYPPDALEVVVVSDGSTDGTADAARRVPGVRVLETPARGGKAAALNVALEGVASPFVVLTDARQPISAGAIRALVRRLQDPGVGAVSGELMLLAPGGAVAKSLGFYWNYEKMIRRAEARRGELIGVTGALYAIRGELWQPIPAGTILDDVLVPMRILRAGYAVGFEGEAQAFDAAEAQLRAEKRRKLRTLVGNYQLLAEHPWMVRPGAYGAWWRFWSHKVLRLVAPYALGAALVSSALAPGGFYRFALVCQLAFYGLALAAALVPLVNRWRIAAFARVFTELNLTSVQALASFLRGDAHSVWRK